MTDIAVKIDLDKCLLCMECVDACTTHSLTFTECGGFYHQMELCSYCESCYDVCTEEALELVRI